MVRQAGREGGKGNGSNVCALYFLWDGRKLYTKYEPKCNRNIRHSGDIMCIMFAVVIVVIIVIIHIS